MTPKKISIISGITAVSGTGLAFALHYLIALGLPRRPHDHRITSAVLVMLGALVAGAWAYAIIAMIRNHREEQRW